MVLQREQQRNRDDAWCVLSLTVKENTRKPKMLPQAFGHASDGMLFYIAEGLVALFLILYGFGVTIAKLPTPIPFMERDPTISYAYVRPATVPTWLLAIISVAIPLVIVGAMEVVLARRRKGFTRGWATRALLVALVLAEAMGITLAITNTIKVGTGRWRPNALAYCNYKGYRDALASGNLTTYLAVTNPTAFGDISFCLASEADVSEAQASFPSGHASISFAGMTYLALYWRFYFRMLPRTLLSLSGLLFSSPFVVAAWVAITRVRDRFHNPDDIFLGAAIGIVAAYLSWRHFYAHKRHLHGDDAPHPLADGASGGSAVETAANPVSTGGTPVGSGEVAATRESTATDLILTLKNSGTRTPSPSSSQVLRRNG